MQIAVLSILHYTEQMFYDFMTKKKKNRQKLSSLAKKSRKETSRKSLTD